MRHVNRLERDALLAMEEECGLPEVIRVLASMARFKDHKAAGSLLFRAANLIADVDGDVCE